MNEYQCFRYNVIPKVRDECDSESPMEEAWLVVPRNSTLPAFWVRANGTYIRHWSGAIRPDYDRPLTPAFGWIEVENKYQDCDPDLVVAEGL